MRSFLIPMNEHGTIHTRTTYFRGVWVLRTTKPNKPTASISGPTSSITFLDMETIRKDSSATIVRPLSSLKYVKKRLSIHVCRTIQAVMKILISNMKSCLALGLLRWIWIQFWSSTRNGRILHHTKVFHGRINIIQMRYI